METTPIAAGPLEASVMQHTPGPWEAKYSPGAGLGVWADLRPALGERYSADFPIAGNKTLPTPKIQIAYETWVQFPSGEWETMQKANMRLMAAAPDLLDALEKMLDLYSAFDGPVGPTVIMARAAIEKALGRDA